MIRTGPITATTTATPLPANESDGQRGQSWQLKNRGDVPVLVGGADVTAETGWQIDPGGTLALDAATVSDRPHLITATGAAVVDVFRTGA